VPLPGLEAERDRLFTLLASLGDFRRGSVSEGGYSAGPRREQQGPAGDAASAGSVVPPQHAGPSSWA
jgi:hypothetical protein